jgi:hypothetical protein
VLWHDGVPFLCALGLFLLSYIGLGISVWPLVVPPALTIWEAAASPSSQLLLPVGAAVLIPIILAHTGYAYSLSAARCGPGRGTTDARGPAPRGVVRRALGVGRGGGRRRGAAGPMGAARMTSRRRLADIPA